VGATSVGYRKVSLANSQSETPSPAEDEETLADAEMAAYVARRKARVAAGTGRKDDLKDIEGFPEDIEPAQPISQRSEFYKHQQTPAKKAPTSSHELDELTNSVHLPEPRKNVRL
jgi:dual specificity tyrosine-phosphorylation-regulated kinase 2/3/4